MAKSRVVNKTEDKVVDTATAPATETKQEDTSVVDTPTTEESTPDVPGIKSVDELMKVASEDERLDTEEAPKEEEKVAPVTPESKKEVKSGRFDKEAIAKIISANDLSLMNKIEQVAKLLPQPSSKIALGLRGLFTQRAYDSNNSVAINIEQKAFYRNFKELLRLPQNDFNEQYKYINWIHKQLIDLEVIQNEKLPTVAGVSPIHVMNVFLYCANKDDAELTSFVYLFTLLDMRVTDLEGKLKGKAPDLSKVSVKKTLLTAEDVEKINKYYNAD